MLNTTAILQPMFVLAAWTACILLLVAFRRLGTTRTARISPQEYALGESSKIPPAVVLANRNYMNLLELPVLFYVGCLTAFVTGVASERMVAFAWVYVSLRVLHSLIHVTYNRVMHRLAVFAASNVVLVFFWVWLAMALFERGSAA